MCFNKFPVLLKSSCILRERAQLDVIPTDVLFGKPFSMDL